MTTSQNKRTWVRPALKTLAAGAAESAVNGAVVDSGGGAQRS